MRLSTSDKFVMVLTIVAAIASIITLSVGLYSGIRTARQDPAESFRIKSGDHTLESYVKYMCEKECKCTPIK